MPLMDRKHAMRVRVNLRRYFTCTSSYNVRERRAVDSWTKNSLYLYIFLNILFVFFFFYKRATNYIIAICDHIIILFNAIEQARVRLLYYHAYII